VSSGRIKNFVPNPDCCVVTSAHGAERKCWRVSLLAAIRGNAENICSPRVLLTVTQTGSRGPYFSPEAVTVKSGS
jgi:hypothetical protein